MRSCRLLSLTAALALTSATVLSKPLPADAQACFREVTRTLADDAMEGRGTGTKGNDMAALAIARWMDGARTRGAESRAHAAVRRRTPASASASTMHCRTPGYGERLDAARLREVGRVRRRPGVRRLRHPRRGLGYDDYAGLDVEGKVVLVLRYEPRRERSRQSPFDGEKPTRYSDLRAQGDSGARTAARGRADAGRAAAGRRAEPDKLPPLKTMGPSRDAGIPVLQVTRALAERWLRGGHGIHAGQGAGGDRRSYSLGRFALGTRARRRCRPASR